jgi:hypothetical protein
VDAAVLNTVEHVQMFENPRDTQMAPPLLTERVMMRHENRELPRAPFSGHVKFFDWGRAQAAEAVEISGSGIFLKTESSLCEGSMLTLRLSLPGVRSAFTVLGKVVRTVKGGRFAAAGMGIRFIDLRPADRDAIVAYVSYRTAPVAREAA